MTDFLDELQTGTVSRRAFLARLSAAAAGLSLIESALPEVVSELRAQEKQSKPEEENPVYSPANIGGGGRIERNFYRDWIKKSRVPMVEGYSIFDAKTQEVSPWPEIGGRGVYLNFSGNVHMDGVILEIPEGKALVPRRHAYEQLIVVLSGRGYTTFGNGPSQQKIEWGEGGLFSPPMNALHRHFNSDPARPARLLAVTTFPFMLQVFGSLGMINDLKFDFSDRYNGREGFFTESKKVHTRWLRTNLVPDIRKAEVVAWEERGKGNASIFWEMGGNTILEPHVSEFPVATYKLGHRHPYEAIILTLNGRGFSLAGKDSLKDSNNPVKIDWKAGSIVSPPYFWYHQHFNTGDHKARYFAITEGDFPKRLGIPLQVEQIEADQEDPSIKKRFEQELATGRARQAHSGSGSGRGHEHHHGHHGH